MMKSLARGGGIPGMPGLGGGAGKKGRQPAPQRKAVEVGQSGEAGSRARASAAKGPGEPSAPRRARHDWTPAPLTPSQLPPGFEVLGQVSLHTLSVGTAGPRIAFCHGLFRQAGTECRSRRRSAALRHAARALLVDLPDHGRSPWSRLPSRFEGVCRWLADTPQCSDPESSGPSSVTPLGGKTAMVAALQHAELIRRLCIVDIAPKSYGDLHRFPRHRGHATDALSQLALAPTPTDGMRMVSPTPVKRASSAESPPRGDHWRWQAAQNRLAADAARATPRSSPTGRLQRSPAAQHTRAGGVVARWRVGVHHRRRRQTMRTYFPRVSSDGQGRRPLGPRRQARRRHRDDHAPTAPPSSLVTTGRTDSDPVVPPASLSAVRTSAATVSGRTEILGAVVPAARRRKLRCMSSRSDRGWIG